MDYLYVSSRSQKRVYRYSLPGIQGRSNSTPFGRNSRTRDIARDTLGRIWAASDDSEIPIQCYDSSGTSLYYISSDLISSASGMAFDDNGILWASNNSDGMIYGIDTGQ